MKTRKFAQLPEILGMVWPQPPMRSLMISIWGALAALSCTCSRTSDEGAPTSRFSPEFDPGRQLDAGALRNELHRPTPGDGTNKKAESVVAKRCRVGTAQQTIRALGTGTSEGDFAPFGVEVGAALVEASGFTVPWLSSDGKTSTLGLTRAGSELLSATTVSLGQVHWDGGPPRVARVDGETLLAVVPDGDAHGESYRVAAVRGDGVQWGADLDGSSDDSPAFDFAASEGKALLVWDDYVREEGRGVIRGVSVSATGQVARDLGRLSPADSDVEAPRLARHENGYWLAWLRVNWTPRPVGAKPPAPATAPKLVAADSEQAALEMSQRWIEVVPLDLDGNLSAQPLRVSATDAMVQGFDMEAGHGGGLVLSWRQDFANSGTSGGSIWTARLNPDGALEVFPVDAPTVGGTLPVLLFDPNPPSGVPHGWLSVEAKGGDSALAALSPFGQPLEVMTGNVGLGVASVLGVLQGQMLLATPKGRDIALQLAQCAYSPVLRAADAGAPVSDEHVGQ
jgi:hypothetical protein